MEELVKSLEKQIAEAKSANEKLEKAANSAAEKTQALEAANEAASEQIELLELENAELKARLSSCKCGSGAGEKAEDLIAKVDGKEYKYKGPKDFVLNGNTYSAEEAISDLEVLKSILELPGQTYLQELA